MLLGTLSKILSKASREGCILIDRVDRSQTGSYGFVRLVLLFG